MSDWACITAKDEAQTIGTLVRELQDRGLYVVVVNDGSADRTGELARSAGAHVITHTQSWGIGPSLLHAWYEALGQGAQRIVQLDAGGSHRAGDLWRLQASTADVVIGSRFVAGASYKGNPRRALLSRLASIACNAVTGARIHDWTSGYRAFTRAALGKLLCGPFHARMHAWQIEVLGHALQLKLTIEEVPISYVSGASSFNWKAVREALGVWSRL